MGKNLDKYVYFLSMYGILSRLAPQVDKDNCRWAYLWNGTKWERARLLDKRIWERIINEPEMLLTAKQADSFIKRVLEKGFRK